MNLIDLGKATVETKMSMLFGSEFDNIYGPQKRF